MSPPPRPLLMTSFSALFPRSHIEGHSTVFGTALNYTVCRLLGLDAEHPAMAKARATLHKFGSYYGLWDKIPSNCTDAPNLSHRRRNRHSFVGQTLARLAQCVRVGWIEPHPSRAVVSL